MQTTPISEMQKFHFGHKINFTDGEEGVLVHVIFDPAAMRITHLGVKPNRFFGKVSNIHYISVLSASSDTVLVESTRHEAEITTPPKGVTLSSHSTVQRAGFSDKGHLEVVATQPKTGELAYIVVRNLTVAHEVLLTRQYITSVGEGNIAVTIPDAILKSLPAYRTDSALQTDVDRILFDYSPLHVDLPGMTARVLDSVLYVTGNISSSLRSDIVSDQVRGIPGLLEVKNELIGDDDLASGLAMALGTDPRTADLPIGVYPRLGDVRLSGAVHDTQQKNRVEEIARGYPGVRSVYNELVVNPQAEMLHVMSKSGRDEDILPGKMIRHTK